MSVRATLSVEAAAAALKPSSFSLTPKSFIPSPGSWFSNTARKSMFAVLHGGIRKGTLAVQDHDGTFEFGTATKGGHHATIKVVGRNFWTTLLMSGDVGFCDAYMLGDVEVDNLSTLFELYMDNESGMGGLSTLINRVSTGVSSLSTTFFGHSLAQSRLNVMAHYDQSNAMFEAMLSPEMMYSCALYGEEEGGVHGNAYSEQASVDLAAAQRKKLHHVLRAARVKPGDRILEFGSGWGGLAIEAATTYGCEVDTLTLSTQQKALAEERIKEAGLEGRIRVHLMDYRKCPPEFEKAFDAFISIEMVEHVGVKNYETYFRVIDWALKSSRAAAVVTSSTFPECRFSSYQPDDFFRRYMFPNAHLPSATAFITAAYASTGGRFTLEGVENHSAHYSRTLHTWWHNLRSNLSPSLFNLPDECLTGTSPADLEARAQFDVMRRKWEYHTHYAATGFERGYITNHMLTFVRENDRPFGFA